MIMSYLLGSIKSHSTRIYWIQTRWKDALDQILYKLLIESSIFTLSTGHCHIPVQNHTFPITSAVQLFISRHQCPQASAGCLVRLPQETDEDTNACCWEIWRNCQRLLLRLKPHPLTMSNMQLNLTNWMAVCQLDGCVICGSRVERQDWVKALILAARLCPLIYENVLQIMS